MRLKSLIAQAMGHDVHPRLSQPADGVVEDAVRIEPLTNTDVASAIQLAVRVLRVRPGDRGEQFASDITDDHRQMFVAKANGQVVAYGRVTELAADEVGPETPAGYYLSGVGIASDVCGVMIRADDHVQKACIDREFANELTSAIHH